MRLLWWIFESTQCGVLRRPAAVTSETPLELSYVVAPTTGFHSASTMRVVPRTLNAGFIDDVVFSPRESVRRMCAPSRMLLAASVANTAARTSAGECVRARSKPMARAESKSRSMWRESWWRWGGGGGSGDGAGGETTPRQRQRRR